MKAILTFLLTLLSLFLCGCIHYKYKTTSTRKTEVIMNDYSKSDSLFLGKLILCNNKVFRYLWLEDIKMQSAVETDQLFDCFYKSVNKLNLPISIKKSINYCDTILDRDFPFHAGKINIARINKIIENSQNSYETILFPVLHINTITQRAVFISSTGMPGGGYYLRDIFLNLAICLIKNNEIIYLKSARYGPVSSETATPDEEPPLKLEQEHWDKLVELVMQDYIKGVNRCKEQNRILDE